MAGFIEDLYYCNLNPQERTMRSGSDPQKRSKAVADIEATLNETLPEHEKHLLQTYMQAVNELQLDTNLDSFIVGFRLGARCIYDAFVSDDAPLDDLVEKE